MPPIAFVTCVNLPEPDPDEDLLLTACREAGIEAELAGWDDPDVDWARFGCAVLRSTWNYYESPHRFRDWLRRSSGLTRLYNGTGLIEWNLDKRYLGELAKRGAQVVPTRYPERASDLKQVILGSGWERFVIKPTVSAASFKTRSFLRTEMDAAEAFGEEFGDRSMMVQPYMRSIENGGEVDLVFIEGQLTHGVVKHPRFHDGEESVSEAIEPSPEQAQIANAVIAQVDQPWLYARVDLMMDEQGRWLLSELELIEPSLFLLQHPPALSRFVDALGRISRGQHVP